MIGKQDSIRNVFRLWLAISLLVLVGATLTYAQDVQGDVYVVASVDNLSPYVGQQIIYSFRLYDAIGLTNPLYQPSDFEGFWRVDIGVVSQTSEDINGRQYTVTTIATALYATQPGEQSIQPSSVVLPETVFRSKTSLTANSVLVQVQSLPEGQPPGFNGAVGQFTMNATLDRQSVSVGQPVTMSLTVNGTGNVEQLPPPIVPEGWRLTVNTGGYSSDLQNGLIVGSRDYQIVLFPANSGVQELPPITLNYFDPSAMAFRSVGTSPIEIDVLDSSGNSVEQPADTSEAFLKLKPIRDLNGSSTVLSISAFILLFFLPILGVGAAIGWQWTRKKRRDVQDRLRQQQALRVALTQIKRVELSDSRLGYEQMSHILQKYVADKLAVEFDNQNRVDILSLLTSYEASKSAIVKMNLLIQVIDEGLFAPTFKNNSLSSPDDISRLLTDVDNAWMQK